MLDGELVRVRLHVRVQPRPTLGLDNLVGDRDEVRHLRVGERERERRGTAGARHRVQAGQARGHGALDDHSEMRELVHRDDRERIGERWDDHGRADERHARLGTVVERDVVVAQRQAGAGRQRRRLAHERLHLEFHVRAVDAVENVLLETPRCARVEQDDALGLGGETVAEFDVDMLDACKLVEREEVSGRREVGSHR
mgnify:CR=1 FL=1